jgi:putative ABC transport system permease protein
VVQDFHFQSLHETISPLVLGHWKNPFYPIDYFACRISSESIPHTISELQRIHVQFDQVTPFEYNFLDERLNDFYQRDIRVEKIFGIAAGLAIFVACLGLLGLAAFTAEQRTKEIGIRKVLGASVSQTVVLLATLIASPVAYVALNRWLQDFAYHITIGLETFLVAGLTALMIALLTISIQTIKAALENPVEALRYE